MKIVLLTSFDKLAIKSRNSHQICLKRDIVTEFVKCSIIFSTFTDAVLDSYENYILIGVNKRFYISDKTPKIPTNQNILRNCIYMRIILEISNGLDIDSSLGF